MGRLSPGMRLLAIGMAILGGSVIAFLTTLSRLTWIFAFVGLVLVFLGIQRRKLVILSESSRRALRLGMIAAGAILVAVGPLAILYTNPVVRAYLPEAELFEELGTFPSTPWGNFVWIALYIGFPAGIMLLVLAFTDDTHRLAIQRAVSSQHEKAESPLRK